MPKKKREVPRQDAHRDKLIEAGGGIRQVELSRLALAALELIKARDNLKTNKDAIEQALLSYAGMKKDPPA